MVLCKEVLVVTPPPKSNVLTNRLHLSSQLSKSIRWSNYCTVHDFSCDSRFLFFFIGGEPVYVFIVYLCIAVGDPVI